MGNKKIKVGDYELGKDRYNSPFLSVTNPDGPTTIVTADSDVDNPRGPNAESTFAGRIFIGEGAEWVDWFHNHYSTNGDMNYGILLQKKFPGSYRNFITAFTDNAVSDPKGQIKNANWFFVITPTIPVGKDAGATLSGTASKVKGSPIITGLGTSFDTELKINDSFSIGTEYVTVLTIDSPTQITCVSDLIITESGLKINKFNRFLGRMGIRVRYPTAYLHIGGGVGKSTAGSAPLKIDPGPLLDTPEDGAVEYDGKHLYFTIGSKRHKIV